MRQLYKFKYKLLFEVSGVKKDDFYYHKRNLQRPDKYASIKRQISDIYHESEGRYGHRRITQELQNRGIKINKKTVLKLMHIVNVLCLVRIKKYKSYKGTIGKIAPNIIDRDFHADYPNQKWTTDVTEFKLFGKKLYLSPILDMYNSEIISYNISTRPNLSMVMDMLDKAFIKIPDNTNIIMHSDQGWHYQHNLYQRRLKEKGIIQSMSRKSTCLDNSIMENFFGLLKSELLYLKKFESIEHFKSELEKYIYWYNNKRIKLKLKMSPIEFKNKNIKNVA